MSEDFSCDLLIAGGGPAGSAAAITAALAGLRVTLLDRSNFPRPKVCGDCLNPSAWPVLDRLGVADEVLALPHSRIGTLRLVDLNGHRTELPLPEGPRGEIAVQRILLDDLLLGRARALGVTVRTGEAVVQVQRIGPLWRIATDGATYEAPCLVAADGRNSTVCRALGLMPEAARDRLGLQTHVHSIGDYSRTVALELRPEGYCGIADVGQDTLDVCLVSTASRIRALRRWAEERLGISPNHSWQSIAPLARATLRPVLPDFLLAGDSARVVEPFTGEGIYYALASGEMAGREMAAAHGQATAVDARRYWKGHARLYHGRLWVNQLTRWSVTYPEMGHRFLRAANLVPGSLGWLSRRIIHPARPAA